MLEDDTLVDKAGSLRGRVSIRRQNMRRYSTERIIFQDMIDDTTDGR